MVVDDEECRRDVRNAFAAILFQTPFQQGANRMGCFGRQRRPVGLAFEHTGQHITFNTISQKEEAELAIDKLNE